MCVLLSFTFILDCMVFFLLSYSVLLVLYFVLQTFFVYGLSLSFLHPIFILLKDVLWFGLFFLLVIQYRSLLVSRLCRFKLLFFPLLILGFRTLFSVLLHWQSLSDALIGWKYDWFYLLIIFSATFVWYVFASFPYRVPSWLLSLFRIVFFVVLFGFVWQGLKLCIPDFFVQYLGYGPMGDFVPRTNPPLYYLTWHDGIVRLSGLFSGPNVLWFFLVLFSSFVLRYLRFVRVGLRRIFLIFYVLAIVLTLSRWAVLWCTLSVLCMIFFVSPYSWKKKAFLAIMISVLAYVVIFFVSFTKTWSNIERGLWLQGSFSLVRDNIWWYGLGYAGPAQHYREGYLAQPKQTLSLLENIYLQLLVNVWLPWLLLWLCFRLFTFLFAYRFWTNFQKNHSFLALSLMTMSFGLLWLLLEGMVLHVFIDSMVNYLFFVPYGMLLWYAGFLRDTGTRSLDSPH